MKNPTAPPWHHLPDNEVEARLKTSFRTGLSRDEVRTRRETHGANALTQKQGRSPVILFLLQFHQPLVYILIASGIVTAILHAWVDASVIFGVVLLNAVIGYLQEAKAVRAMEALARSVSSFATVLRDGERRVVPSEELVPGDVVLLQSGDKVPADLRLFACRELQIDEAPLTGESVPALKQTAPLPAGVQLADRVNMAYSGTLVTFGTGCGAVVATGDATEIGLISRLIAATEPLATPLTRKISRFSATLLWVILALAAVTFAVGVHRGESPLEMFMAAVALAVGAIPEGLPAAVTITLAIGVGKMARRNAIVRKLPAVETLGSTTVICSDKTGTLTENRMTVQEIWAGGELFHLTGGGYDPAGGELRRGEEAADPARHPALGECLRCGLLCNDARLVRTGGEWRVEGDPTEGALLAAAGKGGLDRGRLAEELPRVDAIPFEAQHHYMATLHRGADGTVIYLKGSTESILPRCSHFLSAAGELLPLTDERGQDAAALLARKGLRVLAFARKELQLDALEHADVATGLTFLGLQGMLDPPRPGAMAAVHACRSAGIRVMMITGDHAVTAAAIARKIGLTDPGENGPQVITGRELATLGTPELIEAVGWCSVFARVVPEQKLRLVEALQARGEVVAMTGDGVNDAPALRRADIGVAMGITGTEVAREAADMVLTDDDFSTIEAAVEEGRGVYDNLVKFITWTLPTNLGEGLVILAAVFAGVQLPILPVQILWINMTTAVFLGLMLAFEPREPGIMERPPRPPARPLLTGELLVRIVTVGILLLCCAFGLFQWELRQGHAVEVARTCAVNVFVFGEVFYLFSCRSLRHSMFRLGLFGNRWALAGVAVMTVAQLLFTYLPGMNAAFRSRPIGAREWGLILVGSLLIYFVIEGEKAVRRLRADREAPRVANRRRSGTLG